MSDVIEITDVWIVKFRLAGVEIAVDGEQLLQLIREADNHPFTKTVTDDLGQQGIAYTAEYMERIAKTIAPLFPALTMMPSMAVKIRDAILKADAELKKNTPMTPT